VPNDEQLRAGPNRISRIAGSDHPLTIEVVRGRLASGRAEAVLRFWSDRHALAEEEAKRRLPEVVCLLRGGDEILGVSSVYATEVPLIDGRRFWIYRSLLDSAALDSAPAMVRSTFRALEDEFDAAPSSPLGVCLLLGPDERRRRPEAEWSDPRILYAGYLADGRQVRIGYFAGAIIRHV
jgi:hypothetical protein